MPLLALTSSHDCAGQVISRGQDHDNESTDQLKEHEQGDEDDTSAQAEDHRSDEEQQVSAR